MAGFNGNIVSVAPESITLTETTTESLQLQSSIVVFTSAVNGAKVNGIQRQDLTEGANGFFFFINLSGEDIELVNDAYQGSDNEQNGFNTANGQSAILRPNETFSIVWGGGRFQILGIKNNG